MPAHVEQLNGGLVTTRDPSTLQPGELSAAEDVMLKPESSTLYSAPGRTKFNPSAITAPGGIGIATLVSGGDKVVAAAGGNYLIAGAGGGVFTTLTANAGSSLKVIKYRDKHILLSGGTNKVLLADGTAREHGLDPVTSTPALKHTATGGAWPLGEEGIELWYDYWTTEVWKADDGLEEVESTFAGTVGTVYVSATTSYVTVTRPASTNPEATHWRCYRSLGKSTNSAVLFPNGFLIGELPIDDDLFYDGVSTTTSPSFPTTAADGGHESTTDDRVGRTYNTWTDPDNALVDESPTPAYADSGALNNTPTFGGSGVIYRAKVMAELVLSDFGFTGIGSPITAINIVVNGYTTTGGGVVSVALSWNGGIDWTDKQRVDIPVSSPAEGSISSLFGRIWNSGEFTDDNFRLAIICEVADFRTPVSSRCFIDYATVSIDHQGSAGDMSVLFPNISITAGPNRASLGTNGKPPSATMGTMFQGSLLTNDVDNPTNAAWTIPGSIDYSPVPYRMALEQPLRFIETLGQVAIIGENGLVERINYLPVVEDPEFNTGRARDVIDTDEGGLGPFAVCKFIYGTQIRLFYPGARKLRMTDGFTVETATDDIDWGLLANQTSLSSCFVLNNTMYSEIQVFFQAAGGTRKVLRLSYHPSHLKNGKLKVTGITNYSATCGVAGTLTNNTPLMLTASGGYIYRENSGYTDASGGSILPSIELREIYLAGFGDSWELNSLGVHHNDSNAEMTATFKVSQANYPQRTSSSRQFSLENRALSIITADEAGDGIMIGLAANTPNTPLALNYLVLFVQPGGETTPLKQ